MAPDTLAAIDILPFERHVMPDGSCCFYREKDHAYYRDIKGKPGKLTGVGRLTGVSTVVAPLDFRPDGLIRWGAGLTCDGVSILAAEGLSLEEPDDMRAALAWLASGDAVRAALSDARLTWEDLRDDAAKRGTNVHKHALHALAQGAAVPDFAQMTEEEQGYARGVLAFWHEREPEPLESEQVVWSDTLGVAGRFDLRCGLGGQVVLLDAKTASGSNFIPAKHHGQLAGYEALARECGIGESERQVILRVDAQGDYELVDSTATPEDFAAAVTVYRAAARIGREANAARKARLEAVEEPEAA